MGVLEIDGVSLHQAPAWCCWDLYPLWFAHQLKGIDVVQQPDAHGGWAYPRYRSTTTVTLPLAVSGFFAPNGTKFSNQWVGLETNLAYLRDTIFDMVDGTGTPVASWPATLTMPSGTVLDADVQLSNLTPGAHVDAICKCSFDLTVVGGKFIESGGSA